MDKVKMYLEEAKLEGATKEQAIALLVSIMYRQRDLNTSLDEVNALADELYT